MCVYTRVDLHGNELLVCTMQMHAVALGGLIENRCISIGSPCALGNYTTSCMPAAIRGLIQAVARHMCLRARDFRNSCRTLRLRFMSLQRTHLKRSKEAPNKALTHFLTLSLSHSLATYLRLLRTSYDLIFDVLEDRASVLHERRQSDRYSLL